MSAPMRNFSLSIPDDAIQVKGCTNLYHLQQLTSSNPLKMGFFYNPPGDCQIYHITCHKNSDVLNDNIHENTNVDSDHTFFYQSSNEANYYQISCSLISHSLI